MKQTVLLRKIELLPESAKREAFDFLDFLLSKYARKRKKTNFSFDWEGGLADLKDEYNSVELQHKAMEWR